MTLIESTAYCPYCDQPLTLLIDPSLDEQEYVEDCHVCCQPIVVCVVLSEGEVSGIEMLREND